MKPHIVFVYDQKNESYWKDGLWAAVELLSKEWDITKINIHYQVPPAQILSPVDFVLGWGGFSSPVDEFLENMISNCKKGLCLGGYGYTLPLAKYDVIFYETEWSKKWLGNALKIGTYTPKMVHAFGINTDIFRPVIIPKIWDFITVGTFSLWKRQEKLLRKKGMRLAVGPIQKDNMSESIDILGKLLLDGITVSDEVPPDKLALLYNASKTCYLPANNNGGSERCVLEARSCGTKVEIEPDNPKLAELLTCKLWDAKYYASQLKKGILSCLSE